MIVRALALELLPSLALPAFAAAPEHVSSVIGKVVFVGLPLPFAPDVGRVLLVFALVRKRFKNIMICFAAHGFPLLSPFCTDHFLLALRRFFAMLFRLGRLPTGILA